MQIFNKYIEECRFLGVKNIFMPLKLQKNFWTSRWALVKSFHKDANFLRLRPMKNLGKMLWISRPIKNMRQILRIFVLCLSPGESQSFRCNYNDTI